MEFADTPEQAALRDVVGSFARRQATANHVRATMASLTGYDRDIWAGSAATST